MLSTKDHTNTHADRINTYRKLSDAEIEAINVLKETEAKLADIVGQVSSDPANDKRQIALARNHLETGMMHLIKAVARPVGGLADIK